MQDTAMDILSTVVQHSPFPLSPILVNTAFPATVKCILSTDDNAIMQSGGECLRTFINGNLNSFIFPSDIQFNFYTCFCSNSIIRTDLFVQ